MPLGWISGMKLCSKHSERFSHTDSPCCSAQTPTWDCLKLLLRPLCKPVGCQNLPSSAGRPESPCSTSLFTSVTGHHFSSITFPGLSSLTALFTHWKPFRVVPHDFPCIISKSYVASVFSSKLELTAVTVAVLLSLALGIQDHNGMN